MALLQFSGVACDRISGLSFRLEQGGIGVLRVESRDDKAVVIELAVGERSADEGTVALQDAQLDAAPGGSIAWLPEHGGLINNLKVWENVTLPLWYHHEHRVAEAENRIKYWLEVMGVAENEMADLMASPAAKLKPVERKLAGMLRCLLQEPQLIVVDAGVFSGISADRRNAWVTVFETFVRQAEQRAVLVVTDGDIPLPWEMVKPG
jgi:phospholipid/cholesterol/gamma-HCH transport system ATP-binding protein